MRVSRVAIGAVFFILGCKGKTSAPAPVASTTPASPAAVPDAAQDDSGQATTKVLDPGSDPKSPMTYSFTSTPRVVDATVKRSQVAGEAMPGADATFHFTFGTTPKPDADGGGATIDLKVTKLEIVVPPTSPKEVKAAMHSLERSFVGVVAHVRATAQGEISNPRYEVEEASDAVEMMSRVLEMLVVPLPTVPVGIGARWATSATRHDEDGTDITGTVTTTLVARDARSATIEIEAINTGTMPIPDPKAPKGSTIQRIASSHAQTVIRFDGVAVRSDGDSTLDVTQKVPGQTDQKLGIKVVKSLTSK